MPPLPLDIQLLILESADWDQQPTLAQVCKLWCDFLSNSSPNSVVFQKRYAPGYGLRLEVLPWRWYRNPTSAPTTTTATSPLIHKAILSITHLTRNKPQRPLKTCHVDEIKTPLPMKEAKITTRDCKSGKERGWVKVFVQPPKVASTSNLDLSILEISFPMGFFKKDPVSISPPNLMTDPGAGLVQKLWTKNPTIYLQQMNSGIACFGYEDTRVKKPNVGQLLKHFEKVAGEESVGWRGAGTAREKVLRVDVLAKETRIDVSGGRHWLPYRERTAVREELAFRVMSVVED